MNNLIQLVKDNDLVKIVLILGTVYLFMQYYHKENLENVESTRQTMIAQPPATITLASSAPIMVSSDAQAKQIDKVVAGPTTLTTEDLLPKYDDANEFAKQNPTSKLLNSQNFLTSGFHMGINTVSQSNKIPYHDIRSCPPIVKQDIGPWNNSSYDEPVGSGRRQLEIN